MAAFPMQVEGVVPDYPVWLVLVLVFGYIIAMFAVGYFALANRVDKSESEFFVTKWGMGWVGISFSFAATFASAGYVLGTMGVFYNDPVGLTGYTMGVMFAPIVWWVLARKLYFVGRHNGYSTPTDPVADFYQSERLRLVVASVIIILFIPYMAVNLIAPAELLMIMTGGAIPYWAGLGLMGGVVFVYVYAGGMRGVIWTDVIQGTLIYTLFLIAIPIFVLEAGSYGGIVEAVGDTDVAFGQTDGTLDTWFIVVGWILLISLMHAFMPDRTTRLYTAKNATTLKRAMLASAFLMAAFALLNIHFGWSANALGPETEVIDYAVVELTGEYVYWLLGLLIVVLWAGGMSTLGSGVIGMSAMLTKDIYRKNINPDATEDEVYSMGRYTVTGLILLAIVFSYNPPDYLWEFIAATATICIQLGPLLIGALYWTRSTEYGAYAGFLGGVAVAFVFTWIAEPPIPGTGGALAPSLLVNIILFIGVSLVTDGVDDDEHIRSFVRPKLPTKWL